MLRNLLHSHKTTNPAAMTIDVEDYYHASIFDDYHLTNLPSRIEQSTMYILDILDKYKISATFFCLGEVAYKNPSIVQEIVHRKHEIASHGWGHKKVTNISSAEEFYRDIKYSKDIIEHHTGIAVNGYRAPSFSVNIKHSPWFYTILSQAGYRYSSSINPGRLKFIDKEAYYPYNTLHPHTGKSSISDTGGNILEIPITSIPFFRIFLPAGGGGYFRVLPIQWFKIAQYCCRYAGIPLNFYIHPWEFDTEQPVIPLPTLRKLRHYYGISDVMSKFSTILSTMSWNRMDYVYEQYMPSPI